MYSLNEYYVLKASEQRMRQLANQKPAAYELEAAQTKFDKVITRSSKTQTLKFKVFRFEVNVTYPKAV